MAGVRFNKRSIPFQSLVGAGGLVRVSLLVRSRLLLRPIFQFNRYFQDVVRGDRLFLPQRIPFSRATSFLFVTNGPSLLLRIKRSVIRGSVNRVRRPVPFLTNGIHTGQVLFRLSRRQGKVKLTFIFGQWKKGCPLTLPRFLLMRLGIERPFLVIFKFKYQVRRIFFRLLRLPNVFMAFLLPATSNHFVPFRLLLRRPGTFLSTAHAGPSHGSRRNSYSRNSGAWNGWCRYPKGEGVRAICVLFFECSWATDYTQAFAKLPSHLGLLYEYSSVGRTFALSYG